METTMFRQFSINLGGRLVEYTRPAVMAIVNATPDSFYDDSRCESIAELERRIATAAEQGADIIDIGGCSTRPGSEPPSMEEETARVTEALAAARRIAPDIPLSLDTYRPEVVAACAERFAPFIVNDVSGGSEAMTDLVARLRLPYILTANDRHAPAASDGTDIAATTLRSLAAKIADLRQRGIADVIIDPGFGFHNSIDDDYRLMATIEAFHTLDAPILVGVSRKSMLCRLLDITPSQALPATAALHAIALLHGASIVRAHDVAEARQVISIVEKLKYHSICH